jgi:hypothetical protein
MLMTVIKMSNCCLSRKFSWADQFYIFAFTSVILGAMYMEGVHIIEYIEDMLQELPIC